MNKASPYSGRAVVAEALQEILSESVWREREAAHQQKMQPHVDAHLKRSSLHEKHPVYDFLWEYYSFRPGQFMRWHPGLGVVLQGDEAHRFLTGPEYYRTEEGVCLNLEAFPERRRASVQWVLSLLVNIDCRPARLGCFGLHEWAMVYKEKKRRHQQHPLRMSSDKLEAFVESQSICCSHYDAFRFFSPAGRPLNTLSPEATTRGEMEQKGCIHVTMDHYKWAYKFFPWIGSDLIADTFFLALKAREIDMRASPYDLQEFGFSPIFIETSEGRAEYQKMQQMLSARAEPLRRRILTALMLLAR